MLRQYYLAVNILFVVFFIAILVFSAIDEHHADPEKCIHSQLLGSKCPTCGMIKGFSLILHRQFSNAHLFQKNSIPVFSFFLLEFILRLTIIFWLFKRRISTETLLKVDLTLTLLLVVILFKGIIPQTFYIFYKMILTGNTNL